MDGEHDDDLERRLAEPPPGWRRDGWRAFGQAVAVILIVSGLTIIGLFALLLISLNSLGSNK